MRTIKIAILALLLGTLFVAEAKAQVYVVDLKLASAFNMSTGGTDSVWLSQSNPIPIRYGNGGTYVYGQVPDSISLIWYGRDAANSDSIGCVFQYLASPITLGAGGDMRASLTTLDSISGQGSGRHTFPNSVVVGNENLSLYIVPGTVVNHANGHIAAHYAYVWATLRFYYHVGR